MGSVDCIPSYSLIKLSYAIISGYQVLLSNHIQSLVSLSMQKRIAVSLPQSKFPPLDSKSFFPRIGLSKLRKKSPRNSSRMPMLHKFPSLTLTQKIASCSHTFSALHDSFNSSSNEGSLGPNTVQSDINNVDSADEKLESENLKIVTASKLQLQAIVFAAFVAKLWMDSKNNILHNNAFGNSSIDNQKNQQKVISSGAKDARICLNDKTENEAYFASKSIDGDNDVYEWEKDYDDAAVEKYADEEEKRMKKKESRDEYGGKVFDGGSRAKNPESSDEKRRQVLKEGRIREREEMYNRNPESRNEREKQSNKMETETRVNSSKGERKGKGKYVGYDDDDYYYDDEDEDGDVYYDDGDNNAWMIDEKGYFSDSVKVLPPNKNPWQDNLATMKTKERMYGNAPPEIDLPFESQIETVEERIIEKESKKKIEDGESRRDIGSSSYNYRRENQANSTMDTPEDRNGEERKRTVKVDSNAQDDNLVGARRMQSDAEMQRERKQRVDREQEREGERRAEAREASTAERTFREDDTDGEVAVVGKRKFENAEEIFNELVKEGNELLARGRQGLLGRLDVEVSAQVLDESVQRFSQALTLFPSSLPVVGQRGNALLAHGELKLKFSRQLRSEIAELEIGEGSPVSEVSETKNQMREEKMNAEDAERMERRVQRERGKERKRMRRMLIDSMYRTMEESEELLVEAGRSYRQALSMDKSDFRALYNWGLALCYRGQLIADEAEENYVENADRMFLAAIDKFEAMLSLTDNWRAGALLNWGLAVRDRSRLRPMGSRERVKLLEQSRRLLEQANALDPRNQQARAAVMAANDELAQLTEFAREMEKRQRLERFPPEKWWF